MTVVRASSALRFPRGADLVARWEALRATRPRLRNREAAGLLGVSEAEVLAALTRADAADRTVTRLDARFRDLLRGVPALGEATVLTRNHTAVHECTGRYETVGLSDQAGRITGPGIDLRIFFPEWVFGFAVEDADADAGPDGMRRSLQFFDARGDAVHKIVLPEHAAAGAFADLVAAHRARDPEFPGVKTDAPRRAELPDEAVDASAFRAAWDALRDPRDFASLLRAHGLGRIQALRLAGVARARSIDPGAVWTALNAAAAREIPVTIVAGNPGCTQIRTGRIRNVKVMGPWLNVIDPGFGFHLREQGTASAWIVRKPTRGGTVTGLEVYDAADGNVAVIYGARAPGSPEEPAWRRLAADLESRAVAPSPVAPS